jgi:hypothetical protein
MSLSTTAAAFAAAFAVPFRMLAGSAPAIAGGPIAEVDALSAESQIGTSNVLFPCRVVERLRDGWNDELPTERAIRAEIAEIDRGLVEAAAEGSDKPSGVAARWQLRRRKEIESWLPDVIARDPERQRFLESLRLSGSVMRRLSDHDGDKLAAFTVLDWLIRTWLPMFVDAVVPNDGEYFDIIGCVEAMRMSEPIGDYRELIRLIPEIAYLEKELNGLPDFEKPDGDEAWSLVSATGHAAVEAAVEDPLACPMLDELLSMVCDMAEELANRAIARGVKNFDGLMVDCHRSAVELIAAIKASAA